MRRMTTDMTVSSLLWFLSKLGNALRTASVARALVGLPCFSLSRRARARKHPRERPPPPPRPPREPRRRHIVHRGARPLHQPHHVAHAEDPPRNPGRIEGLERVQLLPHAQEQDRFARRLAQRER